VNPYRAMAEARAQPLAETSADSKYIRARLFRMQTLDNDGQLGFADWSSGSYVTVPSYLAALIRDYNSDQTLQANVESLVDPEHWQAAFACFPRLYLHGFFCEAAAPSRREGSRQQRNIDFAPV
jgi:hypothetical protein